jgi:hypothetical protein
MTGDDRRPSPVTQAAVTVAGLLWLGRLTRMSIWQLSVERWALEIMLTVSSAWAAFALLTASQDRWPLGYALPPHMPFSITVWAYAFLISALCKAAGLLCCALWPARGFLLRVVGLALSATLWASLGAGRLLEDPHTLFGMPVTLLGVSAWWLLLRSPSVRQ